MSDGLDFPTWLTFCDLLFEEGAALDEQRWDEWLALYTDDAVLWAPSWDSETELTADPTTEVSLFYVKGKDALADRMWRWTSGGSSASLPLPRTSHLVGNIRLLGLELPEARLSARWHTQVFRHERTWSYAGFSRYKLRAVDGEWRIADKYVVLTNDRIDTALDLYHV